MKDKEKERIRNFVNSLRIKYNELEEEEADKFLLDKFQKVVDSKKDYLSYFFAIKFFDCLNRWQIARLGDVVIEGKDLSLNILFPKNLCEATVYGEDFDGPIPIDQEQINKHQKVINDSKSMIHIQSFFDKVYNANFANYAKAVAMYGSVADNVQIIAENEESISLLDDNLEKVLQEGSVKDCFSLVEFLPSLAKICKKVAQQGSDEDCYDIIKLGTEVWGEGNLIEKDIKPCVDRIIKSKNVLYNFSFAVLVQPKDLKPHLDVIIESKDLYYNLLACEAWPNLKQKELDKCREIVRSYGEKELISCLMFKLNIKDKDIKKKFVDRYFTNKVYEDEKE